MKRHLLFFAILEASALFLTATPGRADGSQQRFDFLDQRGYFPASFKEAVRELVETQQALVQAKEDEKKLKEDAGLQKQSGVAEAKVTALEKELALYDHPEERDFTALQAKMNDAASKPEEQLPLAQAYVWAYPASPHEADAQQYLQQVQKKLADQKLAAQQAEAARQAAHAKMVQRAQAKDLSLDEWKDFLRDMSQEDVLKYLGRPSSYGQDYWIYSGVWTTDPLTGEKVGLRIDFNGTRVLSVVVQGVK